MPLRASGTSVGGLETYEARLARSVLGGDSSAEASARALLEHSDPATLDAAVGLVVPFGAITADAFDCLADAWETYRHFKHLSWD